MVFLWFAPFSQISPKFKKTSRTQQPLSKKLMHKNIFETRLTKKLAAQKTAKFL
jgi:hypothetical protein